MKKLIALFLVFALAGCNNAMATDRSETPDVENSQLTEEEMSAVMERIEGNIHDLFLSKFQGVALSADRQKEIDSDWEAYFDLLDEGFDGFVDTAFVETPLETIMEMSVEELEVRLDELIYESERHQLIVLAYDDNGKVFSASKEGVEYCTNADLASCIWSPQHEEILVIQNRINELAYPDGRG